MTALPVTPAFRVLVITPRWQAPRKVECAAAGALLLLALPVLLPAALTVWILSGRPPFVAHRRLGFGGAPLWVFKLRTMWNGRSREGFRFVEYVTGEPTESRKPKWDPRITSRFAAFCRQYSIDELPQLWQVVRGELTLVGPRPITALEFERYYAETAIEVLYVMPGLTGLWQIKGRSHLSLAQRRRLDLFLVRKLSLPLYLNILLRTPFSILSGSGAW